MSDHATHPAGGGDGHGAQESHGGVGKYLAVAVALALLSTGSFLTTSDFWHRNFTPSQGWAFMMAISCAKALLVILFFMHVLWEANWKYVLTIPAGVMSIFLCTMLVPDIGWRTWHYSYDRWKFAAIPAAEAQVLHGEEAELEKHEAPAKAAH
jgi:cytochrome c oxidase subunit 4